MKKRILAGLMMAGCVENARIEQTVLGPVNLYHDALVDVHNSKAVQRLKSIDQSGTPFYYCGLPSFSRYDHSMGAFFLVQHYGGDLSEQLSAMTHDASHTAFSHLADTLFDCEGYQDKIHEESLKSMAVDALLKKYDLTLSNINPENKHFLRQEQPLPDVCADRLEYNLHTGKVFGLISDPDIKNILKHLHFINGKWFFDDLQAAKQFSKLSLYFTEHLWGSKKNVYVYQLTAKMLKRALDLKLFDLKTFHYGIDQDILSILENNKDPEVLFYKKHIENCSMKEKQQELNLRNGEKTMPVHVAPKFRGVDPLVEQNGKYVRLTSIDAEYKKEYQRVLEAMKKGFTIDLPVFE